jgi:hypothetical protein
VEATNSVDHRVSDGAEAAQPKVQKLPTLHLTQVQVKAPGLRGRVPGKSREAVGVRSQSPSSSRIRRYLRTPTFHKIGP